MKILFISNLFPDQGEPYRGLDNACVLHQLARQHEVRVIAARPTLPLKRGKKYAAREQDQALNPQFVPVRYIPKVGSRFNHRLFAQGIRETVLAVRREFAFDVILCAWLYPDGCAVAGIAQEINVPFVLLAQGSDVHAYLEMPTRRKLIVAAVGASGGVIARSADLGKRLASAGAEPAKLHAVYNGVDFGVFKPGDAAAARRELQLPLDGKIILFVGNFLPVKNPLLLVRAHAEMCAKSRRSDLHLVMIGGGPLGQKVRAEADRLRYGRQVWLAGRKSAAEVARFMQAADVLCLSSDNEGVPNVVLEAFAAGLPVVATNVGGIHEVLVREQLGRLAPRRNAAELAWALDEVMRKTRDTKAITKHARQFTWENAAAKYAEILKRAVAGRE